MSKGEKRSGLDWMLQLEVQTDERSRSGLPSMPKGEIVGMFTRRACLSLMARTTTTMTNRQTRKINRQAGKEEQQRSKGKIEALIRLHFRVSATGISDTES
jgi:hypothetical protein